MDSKGLRALLDLMETQLNAGIERLESCLQALDETESNEEFEADYSPDWATPEVENELEAMFDNHANSD